MTLKKTIQSLLTFKPSDSGYQHEKIMRVEIIQKKNKKNSK
jgi:hypothetical protein